MAMLWKKNLNVYVGMMESGVEWLQHAVVSNLTTTLTKLIMSLKIFTCHCYISELKTVETSLGRQFITCNIIGTNIYMDQISTSAYK